MTETKSPRRRMADASHAMDAIAQTHHATAALAGVARAASASCIAERGAHAARTVVLLPYAQLMPVATADLGAAGAQWFRAALRNHHELGGRGGLRAGGRRPVLRPGPRPAHRPRLAGARGARAAGANCSQAAWSKRRGSWPALPLQSPAQERAAWAAQARARIVAAGLDAPALALESAMARIALEWAAASAYAGDALLEDVAAMGLDLLVVLEGLQAEPLARSAQARGWPASAVCAAACRRRACRARSACTRPATLRTKPSGPRPACCGMSKPAACRWRLQPSTAC